MKNYIKNGAKILYSYAIALIVFVIFVYPFMAFTKDNFNVWLPLYCFLMFLFLFFIIYVDMKGLAIKEKRPQYELNPYPLKGLVYGMIGIIPIALPVAVASLIHLENSTVDHIKHVAINTFLGPMYFIIRWLNEAPVGYAAAILLLPLIAMLGYLAGFYGINIMSRLRIKKEVPTEKVFKKSPWNPSNASGTSTKKKKKAKKPSGGL